MKTSSERADDRGSSFSIPYVGETPSCMVIPAMPSFPLYQVESGPGQVDIRFHHCGLYDLVDAFGVSAMYPYIAGSSPGPWVTKVSSLLHWV